MSEWGVDERVVEDFLIDLAALSGMRSNLIPLALASREVKVKKRLVVGKGPPGRSREKEDGGGNCLLAPSHLGFFELA
ncbi:UNVERIFIED_CONTAM: hypothetical protein Sradi_6237000 [Sesamum radiatum]|uniref:Uncharacterized protein n=1 Tax=Sesamum radiatum TaxID=300843 RepID=A0AAW2KA15_SESRA